ncbi:BON domain-containing protein [Methylophilus sp. QUAN]|uniref:BON domain-containing protein n=1 Tax=Methylophilus sp. QUAN TaxID=2781020 RepID=UPI00189048F9|nr:BON domain-containing protein [Methylophilus sp. QUAN]MBF4992261.1 BON domain-containing protein [Methylophilus sp. QUAN]
MNNTWLVAVFGVMLNTQAFAVTIDEMRGEQAPYAQAFKALDSDGNGKLSKKEATKDKDIKNAFSRADKNHNGSLDQDEFAAYKSKVDGAENKQAAADSAITAKIKSKYLVEKNLSSFKISVETKDNTVILSGFVDSAEQKARAEKIATSVDGVKSVKNALVVKP